MKVYMSDPNDAILHSFQKKFSHTVDCTHCGEEKSGYLAFVVAEDDKPDNYVCRKYPNKYPEGQYWPHDAIAVAIYFCGKCARVIAEYNQA